MVTQTLEAIRVDDSEYFCGKRDTGAYKLDFVLSASSFFFAMTHSFASLQVQRVHKNEKEEKKCFPWCMELRSCQRLLAGKVCSCVFNH